MENREVYRQMLHLLLGVLLALLVFHELLGVLGFVAVVLVGFVLSALSLEYRIPLLSWLLDRFDRKQDAHMPGKGLIMMALGALVVVGLFPTRIAAASLLVLAVGDSVSHVVGRYFGSRPHPLNPKKLWEGTVWGTITATFAAAVLVPLWAAFFASAVALFFEAVEWRVKGSLISDNVLVPLVAACILNLLI